MAIKKLGRNFPRLMRLEIVGLHRKWKIGPGEAPIVYSYPKHDVIPWPLTTSLQTTGITSRNLLCKTLPNAMVSVSV